MSKECDKPRVMKCRNCDREGHVSKECDQPKDWSRVKCTNCDNLGHGRGRCPEPEREDNGGWGNDGGASTAANPGIGGGDTAPVESTGNWADDTNAAAAADGNSWGNPGEASGR
jgi:cellular nucleic acid-binding protein